jgi:hypothetical protein
MIQAVREVVHNNATPKQALDLFNTLVSEKKSA